MHTNFLNISSQATQGFFGLSEKAKFTLTPLQKKIALIASATIVAIACVFVTIRYCLFLKKKKRAKQDLSRIDSLASSLLNITPSHSTTTPDKAKIKPASFYLPIILGDLGLNHKSVLNYGEGLHTIIDAIPSKVQEELKSLIEKQNPTWKVDISDLHAVSNGVPIVHTSVVITGAVNYHREADKKEAVSELPKILEALDKQFSLEGNKKPAAIYMGHKRGVQEELKKLIETQNPTWTVELTTHEIGFRDSVTYLYVTNPQAGDIYYKYKMKQASAHLPIILAEIDKHFASNGHHAKVFLGGLEKPVGEELIKLIKTLNPTWTIEIEEDKTQYIHYVNYQYVPKTYPPLTFLKVTKPQTAAIPPQSKMKRAGSHLSLTKRTSPHLSF